MPGRPAIDEDRGAGREVGVRGDGVVAVQHAVVEAGPGRVDVEPGGEPAVRPGATRERRGQEGTGEVEDPPLLQPRAPGPPVEAHLGRRGTPHHPPPGRPYRVEVPLHGDVPRTRQLQGHVPARIDRDRPDADVGRRQVTFEVLRDSAEQPGRVRSTRKAQLDLTSRLETQVRRVSRPSYPLDRYGVTGHGIADDELLLDGDPNGPATASASTSASAELDRDRFVQRAGVHRPLLIL